MKSGFVAIAGRPNAGKSTLLNRLMGTKLSIVSPKAQTTRDKVLGILTEPNLGQMVFVDTPGIHRAKEGGVNAYMIDQVKDAIHGAHAIWVLVDPTSELKHEERVIELLGEFARSQDRDKGEELPKVFVLVNKSDRPRPDSWARKKLGSDVENALKAKGFEVKAVLEISAQKGQGLEQLLTDTWALLPEGPYYYPDPDQMSDRPLKFFVGERIREQLFTSLGEELPYACAIEIDKFKEEVKPVRVEAVIHVERESQKGMVIGKGGAKLKEIGQNARKEIEKFLKHSGVIENRENIFLGLRVKLYKDWSKDSQALERLGYIVPKAKKSGGRS